MPKSVEIRCKTEVAYPLDTLEPFQGRLKNLSTSNYEKLKRQILQQGFSFPVFVWQLDGKNFLLDGHQRVRVLNRMKIEGYQIPDVPCVRVQASDYQEAKQKLLAATSQYGEMDRQGLYEFITDAAITPDWLEDNLNFAEIDLKDFATEFYDPDDHGAENKGDEDKVPEVEDNPYGVKRGDIWQLGNHRLMCGDSTDKTDVDRLMDGTKADMVFTDPPYNVASDSKNFAAEKSKAMNDLANSDWDKNFKIEPALDMLVYSVSEHSTMYIWTSHFLINDIWLHLKDFGYTNYLVWAKPNPMPSLSKRHPAWNTELCVYASRGSKRVVNYPSEGHFLSCRDVVKKSDGTHPTQKPQDLITPLIEFSSDPGQLVLDLFLGSGSTLIACEKTGRQCYGSEIDPNYCSVIIQRYIDYVGSDKGVYRSGCTGQI